MGRSLYSRRQFLSQAALAGAGGGIMILSGCTSGSAPPGSEPETAPVEGGTVITDPAQFPAKFSESPDFAKLVADGKLPPVAERIGQDPLVIKPVHSIGRYGGEIRRGFVGTVDIQNGERFCAGPDTLLYWDYQFKNIVPNIAQGYEFSNDDKVLTLHLRRGMRWSDGTPFTADDIIFWREDINLDPDLSSGSTALLTSGGPVQVRKIDDYTVEFIAPVPQPMLPAMLASATDIGGPSEYGATGGGGFAPRHYLSEFLPKYTSMAEATAKAKAAGFQTWSLYVQQLMTWTLNPDLPVVTPWTLTSPITEPPWTFQANPYSIWVDTKGNQLPYIPKITMQDAQNLQVLQTQAVAGAYDFQDRGLDLSSLDVLLSYQKRSKYTIYRAPQDDLSIKIRLNLAYDQDKTIGGLIRDVSFRRALSLAIDREQINSIYLFGTGTPTASMVADNDKYFPGKPWRTRWATHDPEQANHLLDKIGLTRRDSSGFRLRPDNGKRIRLDFSATTSYTDFSAISETIGTHWQDIGIEISVQEPGTEIVDQILANQVMVMPLTSYPTDVFVSRDEILPTNDVSGIMGIPYAQWFDSGGKEGTRPPQSLMLDKAMSLYQDGMKETSDAKRTELGKQIYMMHADQVWSIGVVGFAPLVYGLYLAKNNLGNIPRRIVNDGSIRTPTNALPMTFYYT
jgi:peptide/nickel transport system substrate-binding protein